MAKQSEAEQKGAEVSRAKQSWSLLYTVELYNKCQRMIVTFLHVLKMYNPIIMELGAF